jgi:hypothetical protein
MAVLVAIYGVSTAINTVSITASGKGSVSMLNVMLYANADKTIIAKNLDWTELNNNHPISPNSEVSTIIYATNEGNTPISLLLRTEDWIPTICTEFVRLNWNYNGQLLPPNASMPITLTLQVDEDIQGVVDFTFEIIITGIEE